MNHLTNLLNKHYPLKFEDTHLHRDMIGSVYFVKSHNKKLVFKLFRHFHTKNALQSIDIIQYLKNLNYPVVSIVPTIENNLYIKIDTEKGECIGILYDYIDGIEPNIETDITDIGLQIGKLHQLMDKYPNPLIKRGKAFYIDRFINMLKEIKYPTCKIEELENYGNEIWKTMERLPNGFCHGDLHSGNMFKTKTKKFILFDFDIVSFSYSIIDVATLSDHTNFNQFDSSSYDHTKRRFQRFYKGYSKYRTLSEHEINAIFDFIPARHYELIATITECEGLNTLNQSFLDQQFNWLIKWRDLCHQNRF